MFNKYLKYKNKYLNLKKQIGGAKIIHFVDDDDRFVIDMKTIDDIDLFIITDKVTRRKMSTMLHDDDDIIVLKKNDNYYVIKINKKTSTIIKMTDEHKSTLLKEIMAKININEYIYKNTPFVTSTLSPNIINAQNKIIQLNIELHKKCANLFLRFDFGYNMTGCTFMFNKYNYNFLTLCLYFDKTCVSSIQLHFDTRNKCVVIYSKTSSDYENKKYNKLLRAVVIIICDFIIIQETKINYVFAKATNPISAFVLINSFNGSPPLLIQSRIINGINDDNITYAEISEYIKINKFIDIYIDINEINVRKATDVFNSLLSSELESSKQLVCV